MWGGVEWGPIWSDKGEGRIWLGGWVVFFCIRGLLDRIVKGFLPSELWTFLSRLCVGLVLPPCLPNSIEVYLSYIFRHVLAFCPPPPYITTNSHHSSTHLLNTNILLLSLSLSFSLSNTHKYTHRRLQGIAQKTNNNNCYYYLEYPSARFGILFSLCLSSAYVTGKSHHSSHLLKYPSLALALWLCLSLSHTQIYTQDPTKYRGTQTQQHQQQQHTLLLGVPIFTFWHSFLSVPLRVSLAILTTLPVC